MKKIRKISCVLGTFLFVGIAGVLLGDTTSQAKKLIEKPIALVQGKTYRYDIDGDNKKEKISIEEAGDSESYKVKTTIYVDNKKYATVSDKSAFNHSVYLCDLYGKKKGMNLITIGTADSDTFTKMRIYKMGAKKMTQIARMNAGVKKNLNIYGILEKIDVAKEEGKFYIYPDTPIFLNNFGCYYTKVMCKIDGSKISVIKEKSYTNVYDYTFRLARNTFMYKDANKNSEQITLKAGVKLKVLKIMPVSVIQDGSTTSFVQVQTKKGKTGWIYDAPIEDYNSYVPLFKEIPTWG